MRFVKRHKHLATREVCRRARASQSRRADSCQRIRDARVRASRVAVLAVVAMYATNNLGIAGARAGLASASNGLGKSSAASNDSRCCCCCCCCRSDVQAYICSVSNRLLTRNSLINLFIDLATHHERGSVSRAARRAPLHRELNIDDSAPTATRRRPITSAESPKTSASFRSRECVEGACKPLRRKPLVHTLYVQVECGRAGAHNNSKLIHSARSCLRPSPIVHCGPLRECGQPACCAKEVQQRRQ